MQYLRLEVEHLRGWPWGRRKRQWWRRVFDEDVGSGDDLSVSLRGNYDLIGALTKRNPEKIKLCYEI